MKANTTAAKAAEDKKREAAVNWKIFEVQAILVGGRSADECVSVKSLELGRQWLQPCHYEEVVKERNVDGRCGYPLCNENVNVKTAIGDHPVYNINRKAKSIDDAYTGRFYCRTVGKDCLSCSEAYMRSLDTTMPIAREIVNVLDLSKTPARIDEILSTLHFHDATDSDSEDEESKNVSDTQQHNSGIKQKRQDRKSSDHRFESQGSSSARASNTFGGVPALAPATNIATAEIEALDNDDRERSDPPQFTHKQMMKSGAVQPRFWGLKNGAENSITLPPQGSGSASQPSWAGAINSSDPLAHVKRSASSIRATELLNNLRRDPTKLGLELSPPRPTGPTDTEAVPQNHSESSSNTGSATRSPKAEAKHPAAEKPVSSPSTSASSGEATEKALGLHPSMQPTFHNHNLDPALIKELKPTPREMSLREKYKAGQSLQMQMVGTGPVASKPMDKKIESASDAVAQSKQSPVKPQVKVDSQGAEDDDEDDERLKELDAADAAREMAEYEARFNTGGGYGSWRDERLDTSASNRGLDHKEVKAGDTVAALLEAKPVAVPRVRMNPKGQRAKELQKQQLRSPSSPGTVAAPKELLVMPSDVTSSEAERQFIAEINEEGDKPKASYDNGIVTAKVREVEWKDADPELLKSRLKSVTQRVPPTAIDTMARKKSLFKEQRDRQRQNAGPSPSAIRLERSAGSKTVSWGVQEREAPAVMPESAILTKHDDDHYEYDGKRISSKTHESKEEKQSRTGHYDDSQMEEQDDMENTFAEEERKQQEYEAQIQANRELRKAFFSSTGVSAMIIPEGFSQGARANNAAIKPTSAQRPEAQGTRDEGDVEEAPTLTIEDLEDAASDSEKEDRHRNSDSSDESEPEPEKGPVRPSSFFVLWKALDDLLSHTGAVIKRRTIGNRAAGGVNTDTMDVVVQRAEAKGGVDLEYETNQSLLLAQALGRGTGSQSSGSKQQTILSLLGRGIASAEIALQLNKRLHVTQLAEYYYTKKKMLSIMNADHPCPALANTGWTLLGLLIVDGIVRLRLLYAKTEGADHADAVSEWDHHVRKLVPLRVPGAPLPQSAGAILVDEHELRVLRSFFDDL